MKLMFVGAGAVGGYFGGRLVQSGHDVSFLVRANRAGQIERNGLRISSPLGDYRTMPRYHMLDGIERYTDVFADTLRNENRMCLAGILSAERNELPDDVRTEVVKWGEMNERWIARVLAMLKSGKPDEIRHRARAIFAAVSGVQLIAHSRGDVSVYEEIIATYRASGLIP